MPPVRFLDPATPPHIATLVILSGLSALTMNIFLPSIPGIARHYGVDYAVIQLAVSGYLAFSGALQLIIGPLSDRFGRRPVVLGALALFLLMTLGTLLAPTAGLFLLFRMLQAVVVSGLVLGRAVVRDMVPGAQAAAMIGYVTMGMALAPMVGPLIGGVLDEFFGWKASFVFLGVAGLAVMVLCWFDLGETAARGSGGFRDQFRRYPQLFGARQFWAFALASTFSSGAFFAYIGGAPYVGATVYGLGPAQIGLHFALPAVGYMGGNFLTGRYSVRLGMERMALAGALFTALPLLASLALQMAGLLTPLAFFGLVGGMAFGNGLILPNANAGMMSVRPELAGTASGLGGMLTIGGGALFAALAAWAIAGADSALPLLLVMLGAALASIPCVLMARPGPL